MNNIAKENTGLHDAMLVTDGATVGIGTGSTVYYFIQALAKRVQQGLRITAVPTSRKTVSLATGLGLVLTDLNDVTRIDITIDGADEIDPSLQLIKGGGGALLQEKMVAAASEQLIIIADETKLVKQLGAFPLPVEIIPFGWKQTLHHIEVLGLKNAVLRLKEGQPFISDHGHYILDCSFEEINDAAALQQELNNIPGVVENGLFVNMTDMAVIGYNEGTIKTLVNRPL